MNFLRIFFIILAVGVGLPINTMQPRRCQPTNSQAMKHRWFEPTNYKEGMAAQVRHALQQKLAFLEQNALVLPNAQFTNLYDEAMDLAKKYRASDPPFGGNCERKLNALFVLRSRHNHNNPPSDPTRKPQEPTKPEPTTTPDPIVTPKPKPTEPTIDPVPKPTPTKPDPIVIPEPKHTEPTTDPVVPNPTNPEVPVEPAPQPSLLDHAKNAAPYIGGAAAVIGGGFGLWNLAQYMLALRDNLPQDQVPAPQPPVVIPPAPQPPVIVPVVVPENPSDEEKDASGSDNQNPFDSMRLELVDASDLSKTSSSDKYSSSSDNGMRIELVPSDAKSSDDMRIELVPSEKSSSEDMWIELVPSKQKNRKNNKPRNPRALKPYKQPKRIKIKTHDGRVEADVEVASLSPVLAEMTQDSFANRTNILDLDGVDNTVTMNNLETIIAALNIINGNDPAHAHNVIQDTSEENIQKWASKLLRLQTLTPAQRAQCAQLAKFLQLPLLQAILERNPQDNNASRLNNQRVAHYPRVIKIRGNNKKVMPIPSNLVSLSQTLLEAVSHAGDITAEIPFNIPVGPNFGRIIRALHEINEKNGDNARNILQNPSPENINRYRNLLNTVPAQDREQARGIANHLDLPLFVKILDNAPIYSDGSENEPAAGIENEYYDVDPTLEALLRAMKKYRAETHASFNSTTDAINAATALNHNQDGFAAAVTQACESITNFKASCFDTTHTALCGKIRDVQRIMDAYNRGELQGQDDIVAQIHAEAVALLRLLTAQTNNVMQMLVNFVGLEGINSDLERFEIRELIHDMSKKMKNLNGLLLSQSFDHFLTKKEKAQFARSLNQMATLVRYQR